MGAMADVLCAVLITQFHGPLGSRNTSDVPGQQNAPASFTLRVEKK